MVVCDWKVGHRQEEVVIIIAFAIFKQDVMREQDDVLA